MNATAPIDSPLRGAKVVFALPTLGFAGSERQAFLLARHLKERHGAEVRLISLSATATMKERCEQEGIPYGFFELKHEAGDRLGHLNDLWRFVRLLRQERVDVLMPYCMFQNIICGLTWRLGGARVCIWNQRDEGRSRVAPWMERLAVSQIPRFVSNSTHGAEFLTDVLRVAADRVHVVANGIETPDLTTDEGPSWREKLGLPSGVFTAAMIANLHSNKDHATLLQAWKYVIEKWPNGCLPHLLLAGEFRDRHASLVAQVATLGLQQQVHFLGPVKNVNGLLRSIDLAVFSSVLEGVPNSVLEAMAQGLAVVATDYVGVRAAVGEEGAPLLAESRNPVDLADKILTAASDPELRRQMGARARRRVSEVFGVDQMTEQMTGVVLSEWKARS